METSAVFLPVSGDGEVGLRFEAVSRPVCPETAGGGSDRPSCSSAIDDLDCTWAAATSPFGHPAEPGGDSG